MDVGIFSINLVSLISVCIIIGTIVFAYYKKLMMTYALIITNFVVFIISFIYPIVIYELGFQPIYLSLEFLPKLYTLITSMFVHGGLAHIFGNMIVFLFMGMAFEQRIGRKNFIIIYLLTGICGALTHSTLNLGSTITLVGASGAIFGILGAFAFSYPHDEVVLPIPLYVIMIFRRVKVIYAALLFAVFETIIVLFAVQDSTAHFAHLGGLVSGVILAALLIGKQGEKTKQPGTNTIYYDISKIPKSRRINFSNLRKLATTPELQEDLERIEDETVLQVRDAWLVHFLDKVVCPKCGKSLDYVDRKIWCKEDHFKITY
jgi:membrane associated rhomboid family serine protease